MLLPHTSPSTLSLQRQLQSPAPLTTPSATRPALIDSVSTETTTPSHSPQRHSMAVHTHSMPTDSQLRHRASAARSAPALTSPWPSLVALLCPLFPPLLYSAVRCVVAWVAPLCALGLLLCCAVTALLWCCERCACCGPGSPDYEEAAHSGYAGQWEGAQAMERAQQRHEMESRPHPPLQRASGLRGAE